MGGLNKVCCPMDHGAEKKIDYEKYRNLKEEHDKKNKLITKLSQFRF